MENVDLLAIKSVNLEEMFEGPREQPKDVLVTFESNGERIHAHTNTLTLVLEQDLQRSIDHASWVAVSLAQKYPTRNVLLINTYAGSERMKNSISQGLINAQVPLPRRWRYKGIPELREDQMSEAPEIPPNLRILNCPYATLNGKLLDRELTSHNCEIVVLNSFEYATISAYGKSLLASTLLALQVNRKLSMIIYSQDRHRGLSTYSIGRGAIGMLAPIAGAIWRLYLG